MVILIAKEGYLTFTIFLQPAFLYVYISTTMVSWEAFSLYSLFSGN